MTAFSIALDALPPFRLFSDTKPERMCTSTFIRSLLTAFLLFALLPVEQVRAHVIGACLFYCVSDETAGTNFRGSLKALAWTSPQWDSRQGSNGCWAACGYSGNNHFVDRSFRILWASGLHPACKCLEMEIP